LTSLKEITMQPPIATSAPRGTSLSMALPHFVVGALPTRGSARGWNRLSLALFGLVLAIGSLGSCFAQSPAPPSTNQELEQQQKQLAVQYAKLEEMFLRMSELEAASNPTRAGLLMQAAQLSKQLATQQRMAQASDLLGKGQFSRAIPELESSRENLKKLLELLQSDNRSSRIKDERKRLEDVLKDIRRVENIQRATRGRTEAGQNRDDAANDQRDLEQQLGQSESDLKANNESDENKNSDGKNSDGKNPDGKNSDGKNSDGKNSDGKNSDGKNPDGKNPDGKNPDGKNPDGKNSDGKNSDGKNPDGKNSDGKNPDGKNEEAQTPDGKPNSQSDPSESSPQDGASKSSDSQQQQQSSDSSSEDSESMDSEDSEAKPSSDGKPPTKEEQVRKRVQRARKRMKAAEENLRKDKRPEAIREQQKAEEELQKAIADLERILTQLREEEIERALADLETRLKRMFDWQQTIRDQTGKLASLSAEDRDRQLEIQSNKLSIEQMKVVMEGQRAMMLLNEEGSSQAFPEALEQVIRDAQLVVKRLVAADVSPSTQSIEDEILGALEEMLESLKQVQKKRDEEKQQQQQNGGQSGGGSPQDQPLVDKLSELRLIKTLQLRVNRRTDRLANESNSSNDLIGQVGDPRLREELSELSTRQQKIQSVTREILLEQSKK
jgi:hypothetical protein